MAEQMSSLTFNPPAEFIEEEVLQTYRMPYVSGLKEPRVLQTQVPVRPNLIVHRKKIGDEHVADVAATVCDQLMKSIEGVSEIAASQLVFKDGAEGMLLEFSFPAVGNYSVVQMQALRIDAGVLTTLTLCTEMSRLTPQEHVRFRACLSSATVGAPQ